ncbi:metal dependent phosphohydrolase [Alkaliphilus metalliredigens QYMF]|uniref:Metal dependent phosphohydrolase n=1 Tax=Alkaliphilus metalliredigens (strain QYMF) TaxID=293826 RepID=A6TLC8_ALKMQ|nr:HDOD domain-containing protein [Alkaliphilus metalliredigens]ABR46996.1 metal dependent phosphohydrolase [Alkaliphilus metalliredigens QYMF]
MSMNHIDIEKIVNHVEDIPTLPHMINKIMELTDDPESTVQDIENQIMKDQGLTTRVLRRANSAYYGYPRRISSISQATVLLGFETIRNITLSDAVKGILAEELPGYGLKQEDLWVQSQSCAMISRHIAKKLKYKQADEVYIAGLLRDIGKVILSHYLGERYQLVSKQVIEGKTFLEAEEEVLGFHHAEIGARVAEKWNLPADLVDAIAYHHTPEKSEMNAITTSIVHIADAVTMMMGIGLGVDGMAYGLSPYAIEKLSLTEVQVQEIIGECIDLLVDESSFTID